MGIPNQDKYKELMEEYNYRWTEGQNKFSGKYLEIKESRTIMKNILPESWYDDAVFTTDVGNDPTGELLNSRSQVIHPVASAIGEKLRTDLKANDATFEIEGNNNKGADTAVAMERVMRNTYTLVNNRKKYMHALDHLVFSGTCIAQPISSELKETVIMPDDKEQEVKLGRSLSFVVYDPLTSIIDWNADPFNVNETATWGIVTIGRFCKDSIKARWGVDVTSETVYDDRGNTTGSTFMVDQYKAQLQYDVGLDIDTGLYVREYYKSDGTRYVILQDTIVLEESKVVGAVKGQLPLLVTPFISDPDSVYGTCLSRFIESPLQIVTTIMNQVGDLQALKANMPFITWQGMIDGGALGLALDSMVPGSVLELNVPSDARFNNTGVHMDMDISKAISRPPIEEITQGANWLFEKAMESIWYLTGLNPTSLGGFQDKQIRVSNVTDIINQSSLRNSSALVMNLEAHFFNPMTKAFVRLMSIYYDDFPELEEAGVPQESLVDMRSIRIVNGSYLPADKLQDQQKASNMYQLAMQNPMAMDVQKVTDDLIESMGLIPERYMRDPLEVMLQEQAVDLQQLIQQMGPEAFLQSVQQNAMAQQQGQGGQ